MNVAVDPFRTRPPGVGLELPGAYDNFRSMTAVESITTPRVAKLTVEDFLVLQEAGAFSAYAKSELIDGTIYVVNAQHRPHARAKSRLAFALESALAGFPELEVLTEVGVATGSHSLPEPDIVVTSEAEGAGFVPLNSIRLVGEVSDTSLRHDLRVKSALYAGLGVPEYWVIDLNARLIRQYWSPNGDVYAEMRETAFGEAITAATLIGVAVSTQGL
jgi:Uma2 family endonuclease